MKNLENMKIETERLDISPATVDFAEDIYNALNDSITQYLSFPSPESIDDTIAFLEINEKNFRNGEWVAFSVMTKEEEFVWTCGVVDLKSDSPKLWIRISQEQQWKWYAKEMMTSLISWFFENFDNYFLTYQVDENNEASIALVQKLWWELFRWPFEEEQKLVSWRILNVLEYRIYRK